ncbi:MAG: adenosylcobinamide-phosphate synthase CbiB [Spirochaetaceae bacterium]|jgi:adenosylcobinamide-phosphate synthase|nr:adenosylcobinamide-phosphate synthase CbiB [Spirochaetaceae bacterium]
MEQAEAVRAFFASLHYADAAALAAGFLLDRLLGDPPRLPHPVQAIGWAVKTGEALFRRLFPKQERLAGTLLVIAVCAGTFFLTAGLCNLARTLSRLASFLFESLLVWQILSARSLQREAMGVYEQAARGDAGAARKAVSRIVGRDTAHLSLEEVIRAAVETVAENLADGVAAPLFFLALGGPPLGMLYKAVNTMDSMIGYKNERYLLFGRSAAKLDDGANWVPARLSALLIIAAAGLLDLDAKGALRIYRRDRLKHESPNSGCPESACAGALGVSLGGDAFYAGVLCEKPRLGDPERPLNPGDIIAAVRLMYCASFLCLIIAVAVQEALRGGLEGL